MRLSHRQPLWPAVADPERLVSSWSEIPSAFPHHSAIHSSLPGGHLYVIPSGPLIRQLILLFQYMSQQRSQLTSAPANAGEPSCFAVEVSSVFISDSAWLVVRRLRSRSTAEGTKIPLRLHNMPVALIHSPASFTSRNDVVAWPHPASCRASPHRSQL